MQSPDTVAGDFAYINPFSSDSSSARRVLFHLQLGKFSIQIFRVQLQLGWLWDLLASQASALAPKSLPRRGLHCAPAPAAAWAARTWAWSSGRACFAFTGCCGARALAASCLVRRRLNQCFPGWRPKCWPRRELLSLPESTEDPVIAERASVTLGNNAALSANQVTIRELGGILSVGSKIYDLTTVLKRRLYMQSHGSVNVKDQIEIKVCVSQACENVLSGPLHLHPPPQLAN